MFISRSITSHHDYTYEIHMNMAYLVKLETFQPERNIWTTVCLLMLGRATPSKEEIYGIFMGVAYNYCSRS